MSHHYFQVGDQVVMCEEFKRMNPPIDAFTYGAVVGTKKECVRVRMPSDKLIFSHSKYWNPLGRLYPRRISGVVGAEI